MLKEFIRHLHEVALFISVMRVVPDKTNPRHYSLHSFKQQLFKWSRNGKQSKGYTFLAMFEAMGRQNKRMKTMET